MKKLCALFILTASASMLSADYGAYGYGDGFSGGCAGQPPQQGPYYQQGQYSQSAPQGQYSQGQRSGEYQGADNQYYPQSQRFNQSGSSQYSQSQQGYGYSQNEAGGQQNDQQLTKKIQDSLRSAFSDKYNNVNVSVSNGNVTLTGTVASQEDKQDLEKKVRDMSGVHNVNNQVRVQAQGQAAPQTHS